MRKRTINNRPVPTTQRRCAIDLLDVLQGHALFDPSVLLGYELLAQNSAAADLAADPFGDGLVGLAELDMEQCSPFSYENGVLSVSLRHLLLCAAINAYETVAAVAAIDGEEGLAQGSVVLYVDDKASSNFAAMMPEFVSHWLAEQTPAAATAWALLLMAELRMHLWAFSCGDMPVQHSRGSEVALLMLIARAEGFLDEVFASSAEPEIADARRLFEAVDGVESVAVSLESFSDLTAAESTMFSLVDAPYAVWEWTVESNPSFHPVNWFETFPDADNPWLPS